MACIDWYLDMASGITADWTIRKVREWAHENAMELRICASLVRKRTCGMEILRLQYMNISEGHLLTLQATTICKSVTRPCILCILLTYFKEENPAIESRNTLLTCSEVLFCHRRSRLTSEFLKFQKSRRLSKQQCRNGESEMTRVLSLSPCTCTVKMLY